MTRVATDVTAGIVKSVFNDADRTGGICRLPSPSYSPSGKCQAVLCLDVQCRTSPTSLKPRESS